MVKKETRMWRVTIYRDDNTKHEEVFDGFPPPGDTEEPFDAVLDYIAFHSMWASGPQMTKIVMEKMNIST